MKFFLDTANIDEIKLAHSYGLIDGVTTNPSLVARESGKSTKSVVSEIVKILGKDCKCPVSAEVLSVNSGDMIEEAKDLASIHENIVVKIPIIEEGVKAIYKLSKLGIKTNATLCFSAMQALLVAKVGASFVSPFIGRLDDIDQNGMELIADIRQIYDNYGYKTEILAASIRSPRHVGEAALMGADIATIPFKVFEKLFKHPLTDKGLEKFLADAGVK